MATSIHPTAIVEPGAQLGEDCTIHPYAIVKRWAVLGDRVTVHPFAVVGGDPQDLKFAGAPSYAQVGSDTRIRESVTINRGTAENSVTRIGQHCLLMACSHVGHESVVGDRVVIANCVLIAGHVTVGDHAILGGGAVFHQFIRVGERAMVSGGSRCSLDLPPYGLFAERDEMAGLNLVGLKRSGLPRETVRELKQAFRAVYFVAGNKRELAAAALGTGAYHSPEARNFLEFFAGGTRGFARARRGADSDDGAE